MASCKIKPIISKKLLLLFLVVAIRINAYSEQIKFRHITSDDGLSSNFVHCILQDKNGFMWIGTDDGLNKYDGYSTTIYKHVRGDSTSLKSNDIYCMIEDYNGNLIIGTSGGLCVYNIDKDNFNDYSIAKLPETIKSSHIYCLLEDHNKNLWIGFYDFGISRINYSDSSVVLYQNNKDDSGTLCNNTVLSLFEDSYENIWVGTRKGLDLFDVSKEEFIHFKNEEEHKLLGFTIHTIIEDNHKHLCIGTSHNGLYRLDLNNTEKILRFKHDPRNTNSLGGNKIQKIIPDSRGGIWVVVENEGVTFIDEDYKTFINHKRNPFDPNSLNTNSIYTIYQDNTNDIWFGTVFGGLNIIHYTKQVFQHYKNVPGVSNSLSDNVINGFCEDSQSNIWIATDGGGLNKYNVKTGLFECYNMQNSNLSSNAILTILENSSGEIMVGSWGGGLSVFNKEKKTFRNYTAENSNIPGNNVFKIIEDRNGNILIALLGGGLKRFDRQNNTFVPFVKGGAKLPTPFLVTMIEDVFGNLIIGSHRGFYVLNVDKQEITTYNYNPKHNSLSNNVIRAFYEGKDSTLWIGTEDGLNKFNRTTNKFTHYFEKDGLLSSFISGILCDDKGNMWISTNKGISKFNPITEVFNNYTKEDGLQSKQFNRFSYFKSNDGLLYFGGVNGFNVFDPEALTDNSIIPPIIITDFYISDTKVKVGEEDSPLNQDISKTKKIILTHKQSFFSFKFIALNYVSSDKNEYKYILEGFDKEWVRSGTQRMAIYTNVGTGEYTFRVKGCNNDGVWNEKGAVIKIVVLPPWWKTWWAGLGFTLAAAILLIILTRIVLNRIKLQNQVELEQTKTRFFMNISHEFRTPLTLILGPLQNILESNLQDISKTKQQLNLIDRNAKILLRLINQLLDLRRLETAKMNLIISPGDIAESVKKSFNAFEYLAERHSINYKFIVADNSPFHYPDFINTCYYDADILEKIVYNIISNAFKYTPDKGNIAVELRLKNSKAFDTLNIVEEQSDRSERQTTPLYSSSIPTDLSIEIIITDTGIGIAKNQIPRIFNRFYRVDSSNIDKNYSGTGIGLALTKELVDLHQGKIKVETELSKGSIFIVELPISKEKFPKSVINAEQIPEKYSDNKYPHDTKNTKLAEALNKTKSINDNLNKAPILLIVDDNPDICLFIKQEMISDYYVIEAGNGKEGIQMAEKHIPDLIISDVMMPIMDGLEFCTIIKNNELTCHIPIILLTARALEEHQIAGLKTGVDDYISKPFNLSILKIKLKNLITNRDIIRKRYDGNIMQAYEPVDENVKENDFRVKLMAILDEDIDDEQYDVQTLANKMNLSRIQLNRKIKGQFGLTCSIFIKNYRLEKSALLLANNTNLNITEIAHMTGFKTQAHFSRSFAEKYNIAPSDYRRKNIV